MSSKVYIWAASGLAPSGDNVGEIFDSIGCARRCTGPIRNFDTTGLPPSAVGEVGAPDHVEMMSGATDRKSVFLDRAAGMLAQSWPLKHFKPEGTGFFIGLGPDRYDLVGHAESGSRDRSAFWPFLHSSVPLTREIAANHGFRGQLSINVTACTAASQAIGLAFRHVKSGLAEGGMIVAGGADSMLNVAYHTGFQRLGALSRLTEDPSRAARPFDKHRSGVVLGEGAALFAIAGEIENPASPPLAEIVGYASSMDAYMITDPEPSGEKLSLAALRAIEEAGIAPEEIDYVNLHGTSTPKNDLAECAALYRVFGARASQVPVYSMKGQIGHASSGCGAIELLACLWSFQNDAIPVTVNFETPDPEIPLLVVKDAPLKRKIRYILKLNSAFGGQNTALVVKRHGS